MVLRYLSPGEQSLFIRHLSERVVIPIASRDDYLRRDALVEETSNLVQRRKYVPSAPLGFLTYFKPNGIPRRVPILSLQDSMVAFACAKELDRQIVSNAHPGCYGAWELGSDGFSRVVGPEPDLFNPELEDSTEYGGYSYTPYTWFLEWTSHWQELDALSSSGEFSYVANLDVANFYNSVSLPLINDYVARIAPEAGDAGRVLGRMYEQWNIPNSGYRPVAVGLPQDIVGDVPRLLANGALQYFDGEIISAVDAQSGAFRRFSDDMSIFARSELDANDLKFRVATLLDEFGLQVNNKKAPTRTVTEFRRAWNFDMMRDFHSGDYEAGFQRLRHSWNDHIFERQSTGFKTLLNKARKFGYTPAMTSWVEEKITQKPELLLGFKESQFKSLLSALDPDTIVERVVIPVAKSRFSQPQASLLKAMWLDRGRLLESFIPAYEAAMRSKQDPVLDLLLERKSSVLGD